MFTLTMWLQGTEGSTVKYINRFVCYSVPHILTFSVPQNVSYLSSHHCFFFFVNLYSDCFKVCHFFLSKIFISLLWFSFADKPCYNWLINFNPTSFNQSEHFILFFKQSSHLARKEVLSKLSFLAFTILTILGQCLILSSLY